MDQVHRLVSVILYLAENAQEFIFVHIPNKNTGDNPLRQKKIGRTTFFLGATPMQMSRKITDIK
jgi:hypothetical protein